MDPTLAAMLTDTVQQAAYTGTQDVYGAPVYATPVVLAARVDWKVRRITNHAGEERISRAQVFFNGDVTLGVRDKMTLPDGTSPPIQVLSPVTEEVGALDHWEVWF